MKNLPKADQFIADMKRCRGIEFARIGMQVEVDGDMGTIVGMNSSANLDVVFVNQLKYGKGKHNCHPTWEICYFGADGKIIADYRKKAAPSKTVPSGEASA
jgi:hypothetical protein